MSIVVARQKRTALYLSICGLLATVAAVSAVSARDPSGVTLRVGMIMMTAGAAMWLPWRALIPTVLAIWLGPNYVRCLIEDETLFSANMLLELPGLLGLGFFATMARNSLRSLEDEDLLLGAASEEQAGLDPETGVYEERLFLPALEAELIRSRRFNREFAIVLVGIDPMRQRFDYRDEDDWRTSFTATAQLLRSTRVHIDRAYRYGDASFALILPESGAREVTGMVRRLRYVSRQATPAEGEPGGPLPAHFGATFFPQCATTPDDLLRRAEVALKIAEKSSNRVQLDGAEAPDMPPPETLRRMEPAIVEPIAISEPAAVPSNVYSLEQPAEAPTALAGPEAAEPVREPVAGGWSTPAQVLACMPSPATPHLEVVTVSSVVEEEPTVAPMEPVAVHAAEPQTVPVAWQAPQPQPQPIAETPPPLIDEPALAPVTQVSAVSNAEPAPLDNDVAEILKHLDETLDLIRSLRTTSPAS